jgi:hypothetical protein
VQTPIEEIPDDRLLVLPTKVFITYTRATSAIATHRRIVGCEPPPVETHTADCQDHERCAEDWRTVWWNGMGRYILDGRNPQTHTEAIQLFRNLEFGAAGHGCRNIMFEMLTEERVTRHERQFVTDVIQDLVKVLKFTPEGPVQPVVHTESDAIVVTSEST